MADKDSLDASRQHLQAEASRLADAARDRASDAFEEIKLASNQVVDKVRELIEEGNVRSIALKKGDRTLFEIPLTVGVGAGAAALLYNPIIAAVGAVAALVSDVTLVVERTDVAHEAVANVNDPVSGQADDGGKTVGKPSADDA